MPDPTTGHQRRPGCTLNWCDMTGEHPRHEQVVGTWLDATVPGNAQHPLNVQLVRFAYRPFVLGVEPVSYLALTIIEPRTFAQTSVTLSWESWSRLAGAVVDTADAVYRDAHHERREEWPS